MMRSSLGTRLCGVTLFLGLLLGMAAPSSGQEAAPEAPTDSHHRIESPDAECFARWDPTLKGWWVLTPGTTPACEARDNGDVECQPHRALATLVPYNLPNGAPSYKCGPEVVMGAGCVFVKEDLDEPFKCEPKSGISMVCLSEQGEWDCLKPIYRQAREEGREPTKAELAECEPVPWIKVYTVTNDAGSFECSLTETESRGGELYCESSDTEPEAMGEARCEYGCGSTSGGGNCQISSDGRY